jgi:serine/threonine-protein kinase RsbW
MTTSDYTTREGLDFSDTDAFFSRLLAGTDWLGPEGAYVTRLGLHELLVNIRRHAYRGGAGAIDISATATSSRVTVIVEDAGCALPDLPRRPLRGAVAHGGYGLRIIDQAFDEVTYERLWGRNRWTLRVFAPLAAADRRPTKHEGDVAAALVGAGVAEPLRLRIGPELGTSAQRLTPLMSA